MPRIIRLFGLTESEQAQYKSLMERSDWFKKQHQKELYIKAKRLISYGYNKAQSVSALLANRDEHTNINAIEIAVNKAIRYTKTKA